MCVILTLFIVFLLPVAELAEIQSTIPVLLM